MALKLDKARKAYQESKRGGDFWSPDEGETRVYLHPPCREDDTYEPTDGLNYLPLGCHYALGADLKSMAVCLDAERNKILNHPFFKEAYRKEKGGKLNLKDGCPICQAIYEGTFGEEERCKGSRYQLRYLWGVTPFDFARRIGGAAVTMSPAPSPYMTGPTVYDGFMKAIVEVGDVTDLDQVVLIKIVKTGSGLSTKYQVSPDIETVKAPLRMDKAFKRVVLEAIKPYGECDLFKVAISMVKTHGELTALTSGVKLAPEEEEEEVASEGSARPACFGRDYSEDEECLACGLVTECGEKCAEKEVAPKAAPKPAGRPVGRPPASDKPKLPPVEPAEPVAPKVATKASSKAVIKASAKPAPKPEPEPEPEEELEPEEAPEPEPEEEPEEVLEEAPEEEANDEEDLDKLEEQLQRMSNPKDKGATRAPAKTPVRTPVKR